MTFGTITAIAKVATAILVHLASKHKILLACTVYLFCCMTFAPPSPAWSTQQVLAVEYGIKAIFCGMLAAAIAERFLRVAAWDFFLNCSTWRFFRRALLPMVLTIKVLMYAWCVLAIILMVCLAPPPRPSSDKQEAKHGIAALFVVVAITIAIIVVVCWATIFVKRRVVGYVDACALFCRWSFNTSRKEGFGIEFILLVEPRFRLADVDNENQDQIQFAFNLQFRPIVIKEDTTNAEFHDEPSSPEGMDDAGTTQGEHAEADNNLYESTTDTPVLLLLQDSMCTISNSANNEPRLGTGSLESGGNDSDDPENNKSGAERSFEDAEVAKALAGYVTRPRKCTGRRRSSNFSSFMQSLCNEQSRKHHDEQMKAYLERQSAASKRQSELKKLQQHERNAAPGLDDQQAVGKQEQSDATKSTNPEVNQNLPRKDSGNRADRPTNTPGPEEQQPDRVEGLMGAKTPRKPNGQQEAQNDPLQDQVETKTNELALAGADGALKEELPFGEPDSSLPEQGKQQEGKKPQNDLPKDKADTNNDGTPSIVHDASTNDEWTSELPEQTTGTEEQQPHRVEGPGTKTLKVVVAKRRRIVQVAKQLNQAIKAGSKDFKRMTRLCKVLQRFSSKRRKQPKGQEAQIDDPLNDGVETKTECTLGSVKGASKNDEPQFGEGDAKLPEQPKQQGGQKETTKDSNGGFAEDPKGFVAAGTFSTTKFRMERARSVKKTEQAAALLESKRDPSSVHQAVPRTRQEMKRLERRHTWHCNRRRRRACPYSSPARGDKRSIRKAKNARASEEQWPPYEEGAKLEDQQKQRQKEDLGTKMNSDPTGHPTCGADRIGQDRASEASMHSSGEWPYDEELRDKLQELDKSPTLGKWPFDEEQEDMMTALHHCKQQAIAIP